MIDRQEANAALQKRVLVCKKVQALQNQVSAVKLNIAMAKEDERRQLVQADKIKTENEKQARLLKAEQESKRNAEAAAKKNAELHAIAAAEIEADEEYIKRMRALSQQSFSGNIRGLGNY
jgi:ribosomal protein L19E